MKEKYLFELERNLELQASGFLMQKDNLLLQSQLRTEHFQIKMLDRIRAMQNNELILDVLDLGNIKGILKEVASDHICLEVGQKEIIIPTWSIQWSKSLIKMSKSATMLQSKWNLQSLLRSVLIEKLDIQELLIAISDISDSELREIAAVCQKNRIPVRRTPGFAAFLDSRIDLQQLED